MTVLVDSFCVRTAKGEWIYLTLDRPFWGIEKYKFSEMFQIEWKRLYDWVHVKTAENINNQ